MSAACPVKVAQASPVTPAQAGVQGGDVTPAQAGVQTLAWVHAFGELDSGLRRNDGSRGGLRRNDGTFVTPAQMSPVTPAQAGVQGGVVTPAQAGVQTLVRRVLSTTGVTQ